MAELYPECEKIQKAREDSQKIGEFLSWLSNEKGIFYCSAGDNDRYKPMHFTNEEILAEYYNIDLKEAELERQRMLKQIQDDNTRNGG